MIPQVVILPLLVTQVLSAPTLCVESCGSYVQQYQAQGSSNYHDHSDLTQAASRLQGLDYSRPGTWNEHNDYNVDNGHGKVHEERGQVVEGPKTVRYYKKNYTSSYSTSHTNGAGLSELEHRNNDYVRDVPVTNIAGTFDSQRAYNQIGASESIAQQDRYNRIQNQHRAQSAIRRTNTQSERLEDFGEYSGNSQTVQGASNFNTQISQEPYPTVVNTGNWSNVDSYKTDGGRGRVYEEEGQYTSGGKKVRYYKRNYTSGYSSTGVLPIPEATAIGVHDLHQEMEKMHREIGKEVNQVSNIGNLVSSNIAQTNANTYGLIGDNHRRINNNSYRNRFDHRNEDQQLIDTTSAHVPPVNPSQSTYGTNSYSKYERHESRITNHQPIGQFINPTSGYTNVLSTGNSGYSSSTHDGRLTQQVPNLDQTDVMDRYQSQHVQDQMTSANSRRNVYNQNGGVYSGTPGRVTHYNEHWSSSQTKATGVPQYSGDISQISGQSAKYNAHQYGNQHTAQQTVQEHGYMQQHGRNFHSGHQTRLDTLMNGGQHLGHDTVDCQFGGAEHSLNSEYQTRYKRSIKPDKLSDMEQHSDSDDFTQKTSGKLELEQQSQHSFDPWSQPNRNPYSKPSTHQPGKFEDYTQQTSGKLEFGSPPQHPYQPRKPGSRNQYSEDLTQQTGEFDDLTQQTGGFDDLTQQTSGKLELGSLSQNSYQPQWPGSGNQYSDDLTQQTGEFDDLTQQTSGKLEFGSSSQHSYQPRKPGSRDQHSEDLTQQTGKFDDLTQQTSGKLDYGPSSQYPYQPRKPGTRDQHSEDLTQQTGKFDDLTQQTSGKLEFGPSYQPRTPGSRDQNMEDLTQQTGGFDDLTQQTNGKLELEPLSQHSYQPRKPGSRDEHLDDLTQQTGEFDDLTQQTSGKLEFGPQSHHSYPPQNPGSRKHYADDLTQQTGDFDDLTQQTSGKLDFGPSSQHPHQPHKPGSRDQHSDNLMQQTGEFDDLTEQTSGKLEFGPSSQHSNQPRRPGSRDQHSDDLTQQTGELDDLTQQTSGKLEFGSSSQHSNQPRRPGSRDQHSEDLTQQTGEFDDLTQQTGKFDDLTQQTSGKLDFGPSSQYPYQPRKPGSRDQLSEDFTQQTGGFDDLTQQTSGKLELEPLSQHSYQPRKPGSRDEHLDDLTQQTGEFDDLTQQTSGKLEFGPQSHHSYPPQNSGSRNQYSDDLTQQTGDFGDFTQQTNGKLETGQLTQSTHHPWKPDISNQHSEDLTQQTGNFDDLTQQTTGKLEFGQQSQNSYYPWKPSNQQSEDLTQQVGKFDDLTLQTSDKISTGQSRNLHKEDSPAQPNESGTQIPKPAEKPKPRSRYSRRGSVINIPAQNQVTPSTTNQQNELPPKVLPEIGAGGPRSENVRGDQNSGSTTDKSNPKDFNQNFGDLAFGNDDQDRLQKSNDATVGMQWHYTYHPSDQRHFVQQPGQKEKDNSQQHLSQAGFTLDSQHALEDLYLQSPDQRNEESGLSQQSQKNEYNQETELDRKLLDNIKKEGQFESHRQTAGHTKNQQNLAPNSGTENKLEPRILEAYGGGPYDASHSDDIYTGVRVNPSATLPPIVDEDPWYIREKPRELNGIPEEATPPPMSVRPLGNEPEETTPPPSFWSRIGNKITNSFDKAKEKARNIFG